MRHYLSADVNLKSQTDWPAKSLPELIELPEIVIWTIAKHLNYQEHQNLRLACKKLKEIIDQRTAISLHLFVKVYPFQRELCHIGHPISYANSLHVCEKRVSNIIRSIDFRKRFAGLLKLTIHYDLQIPSKGARSLDLNELNCFKSLVHLEIEGVVIKSRRLSLPNLKVAILESIRPATLGLSCPQLSVLGLKCQTVLRLTNKTKSSIEHLYMNEDEDSATDSTEESEIYQLLQRLSSISFRSNGERSKEVDKFVLALLARKVQLPRLRRIRLIKANGFDRRGAVLRNLLNLKRNPETKHIEIEINSKVMAVDELTEMFSLLQTYEFSGRCLKLSQIQHFIQNPTLHCLLPGVQDLRLWCNEDVTLSKQLIEELEGLRFLTLGEEIEMDADCFEEFFECVLRRCRGLRHLTIGCACLKQEQLDRMPPYMQELTLLCFATNFSLGNFNFDFLKNFRNLIFIEFDGFNIQRDTMEFILNNCVYQPEFKLKLKGQQTISIIPHRNKYREFRMESDKSMNRALNDSSIQYLIDTYYKRDLFNRNGGLPIQIHLSFGEVLLIVYCICVTVVFFLCRI